MNPLFDVATSATLLHRLRDGKDHDSWQTFFERYVPMVRAWCAGKGLPHDDIDEVASSVLASLAQAMKDFRYNADQGYRKWLKTVVNNRIASS